MYKFLDSLNISRFNDGKQHIFQLYRIVVGLLFFLLKHAFYLLLSGLVGVGFCWFRNQICDGDASVVDHIENSQQMIIEFQVGHGRNLQMVIAKRILPICGYGIVSIHFTEDGCLRANGGNGAEDEMRTVVIISIKPGKACAVSCVENTLFLCEKLMRVKIRWCNERVSNRGVLQYIPLIKINGYPKRLVN